MSAIPFTLKRSHDVVGLEITTTTETVHGLLRVEEDTLVFQWRTQRATEKIGLEIRTDSEIDPVRGARVPLSAVAAASVRRRRWPFKPELVLTAADLRAFDVIAGQTGLRMEHPAQLVLTLQRSDHAAAEEFATELELALSERLLRAAEPLPSSIDGA